MPHLLARRRPPRLGPPLGNLPARVGMSRLLLWRQRLDPGLGNQLAGSLLDILEARCVKLSHPVVVADSKGYLSDHKWWPVGVGFSWAVAPRPSASAGPLGTLWFALDLGRIGAAASGAEKGGSERTGRRASARRVHGVDCWTPCQ